MRERRQCAKTAVYASLDRGVPGAPVDRGPMMSRWRLSRCLLCSSVEMIGLSPVWAMGTVHELTAYCGSDLIRNISFVSRRFDRSFISRVFDRSVFATRTDPGHMIIVTMNAKMHPISRSEIAPRDRDQNES